MKISTPLAIALGLAASVAHAQTPPPAPPGPGGPPHDPWGDAAVTREESQAKAAEMFDGMDKNKDGVIKEAEEDTAVLAAGPAGRMIASALHRADTDGDGKLTREEFLASQRERFDRQDADHDGKLTKAERDAARQAMMQRMQQRRGQGGPGGSGGGYGPPQPPSGE